MYLSILRNIGTRFLFMVVSMVVVHCSHAATLTFDSASDDVFLGPVPTFLEAGTYEITTISGAWNPWGAITCPDSCDRTLGFTGYIASFGMLAFADVISRVVVDGTELTAQEFFPGGPAYVNNVGLNFSGFATFPDLVHATPEQALASAPRVVVDISQTGFVYMGVDDGVDLADNFGSITVAITAVPLPSALPLLGCALVACSRYRRRAR